MGKISSFETLGTLDGPGVRFIAFVSGCNLRCGCCHNPETWDMNSGGDFTADEIVEKAVRYKTYFNGGGGITVSGGEPLLQASFVGEIFEKAHENGINTCLDTSGSIINDEVLTLLDKTDYCLLDIKYANDKQYREFVGCPIDIPLRFLEILGKKNIPTTVRRVIIPELNDDEDEIKALKELCKKYKNVEKIELLPFKKYCKSKYEKLGFPFRFEKYDEPSDSTMSRLNKIIE